MEGFLGSKQFRIAAVIGGLLLIGAAATYTYAPDLGVLATSQHACDAPITAGTPLAMTPRESVTNGGRTRTVTYALDAAKLRAGIAQSCTLVGDVHVTRAAGSTARAVFTITGDAPAVGRTVVDTRFLDHAGALDVAAWEATEGRARTVLSERGAQVALLLELPDAGGWDLRAATDVGNVDVGALLVGNATLDANVGDVRITGADLLGNLTGRTDVGNVGATLASLQTGKLLLRANVGDITARLPVRADVGYDATGAANVGEVTMQLGELELNDRHAEGPSQDAHARTKDFATKPTQVVVSGTTDVGKVLVESK